MPGDLAARRHYLLESQNPDGGWGYIRAKESWLEPTVYATLALHGDPAAGAAVDRAWTAVRSWQAADGGWRPGPGVDAPGWGTALAVTLHCVRGVADRAFERGVEWLVSVRGDEGALWKRVVNRLQPGAVAHDARVQGWPWLPGNSSWVEPTAHALIALKKALTPLRRMNWAGAGAVESRIEMAERMLADRRCADGGWNYGNKLVQDVKLPSYPETTALALVGLQGGGVSLAGPLELARSMYARSRSPLARAWLAVALRNHGITVEAGAFAPAGDIMVTALETLAEGNHRLLGVEAA
jgi:hypothetical protein